jgi:hypothetical protein
MRPGRRRQTAKRTGFRFIQDELFDVPAPALVLIECGDLLDFQIVVEPPLSKFATDAGLLVATPGGFGKRGLRAVDLDDAGTQRTGDALAAGLVL